MLNGGTSGRSQRTFPYGAEDVDRVRSSLVKLQDVRSAQGCTP